MKYGKLIDVTIPLDYYSGMPKGFAFVEYPFYLLKSIICFILFLPGKYV
jgi:hypothetical protein